MLVGSSVHNQRIERLWRDMHRCVTSMYYRLFYFLEHNELLNPTSTLHLFALHYIYIPSTSQGLQQFLEAWHHHGMRQSVDRLPTKQDHYVFGILVYLLWTFFYIVTETYGVDSGLGVTSDETDDEEGVEIPATELDILPEQISELQSTVDPLGESEEFGVDLLMETVEILQSFISAS